jgi:hypothetical protein
LSKWKRKADSNHSEITAAYRKIGARVLDLSRAGGGVPDLLVGYRGTLWLVEIKTETGKLNALQQAFHALWKGYTHIVRTPEEAVKLVTNG